MRRKIIKTLIGFGIAIAASLLFGVLFAEYSKGLPAERQDDVLIKALPFVATFVAILLGFICLIAILAVLLNGRIPQRAHRPIELIIILGILLGVVGLFQPWKMLGYEYGLVLLLVSTLAFILWSHITPAADQVAIPPLDMKAQIAGVVVGVILAGVVTAAVVNVTKPQPPYGINPTLWSRLYEGKEKGEQLIKEKEDNHRSMMPVFVLLGVMAGGVGYVIAREGVAFALNRTMPAPRPAIGTGSTGGIVIAPDSHGNVV